MRIGASPPRPTTAAKEHSQNLGDLLLVVVVEVAVEQGIGTARAQRAEQAKRLYQGDMPRPHKFSVPICRLVCWRGQIHFRLLVVHEDIDGMQGEPGQAKGQGHTSEEDVGPALATSTLPAAILQLPFLERQ